MKSLQNHCKINLEDNQEQRVSVIHGNECDSTNIAWLKRPRTKGIGNAI